MLDGISLDPHVVLGLDRGASRDEVREAFRRQSKKYHPDHGGDEWAFRIVVRAYEALTIGGGVPAPSPPEPAPVTGRIRPGVHDRDIEPTRLVLVEIIWMRLEAGGPFLLVDDAVASRTLSGSLSLTWPDPALPGDPRAIPFADRILLGLNSAYASLRSKTRPTSARSHVDAGRFEARLLYPSGNDAWTAFKGLHANLTARGLGVRQWTRDLTIPRAPGV